MRDFSIRAVFIKGNMGGEFILAVILLYIFISINIYSQTYSYVGIDSVKNMKNLIEKTGLDVYQIDIPWGKYHLDSRKKEMREKMYLLL